MNGRCPFDMNPANTNARGGISGQCFAASRITNVPSLFASSKQAFTPLAGARPLEKV